MQPTHPPARSDQGAPVKNIVISGTNFWNPGDDFVRDGVIHVLEELFRGVPLNFLFYNFNADFFPQHKFSGIGNWLSRGDLDQFRDSVDAIVIAGLSAGDEIKDLYEWILGNGLQDRVYLIGAGYENDYVAEHIAKEPEATVFQHARIIVGRTARTPAFLRTRQLPYAHVNCPAILSVPEVKEIASGKKIERIGFSIQLPHGQGLMNHSCALPQSRLAVELLLELSKRYAVEVVAHHKSEYFHFLKALRGHSIPVLFSSFYGDLFDIYPRYDLVVTTRLHSSLFANGHGIPGIIINDTARHTHTLDGFPHSVWVNTKAGFAEAIARVERQDLRQIAIQAQGFKRALLQRYVDILSGPFGLEPQTQVDASPVPPPAAPGGIAPDYQFNSELKEQQLVRHLVGAGQTVFDVGAHAGKYTRLFSLLVGPAGRVFAFEPAPDSFQRLALDVVEAGLKNVTLLRNAVAGQSGPVTLHQFPEEYSSWNSLGRPRMEDPKCPGQFVPMLGSVEVDAVTLDAFCREHRIERIDYLKLDVEGAEIQALRGARELLAKKAIRFLQFEISRKMLEGLKTTARAVFDYLAGQGYQCHAITADGRIGRRAADSDAFYENYLALPDPAGAVPIPRSDGPGETEASLPRSAPRPVGAAKTTAARLDRYQTFKERIESVPGFLCSGQEKFLFDKVRSLPDDALIVEIGSFKGRSTVAMGFACLGTRRHVYCIDTWAIESWEGKSSHLPPEGTFPVWQENVRRHQLEPFVTALRGRSEEVLSRWSELAGGRPIDFIFIDGSHEYAQVRRDFELALPLVKAGGWIAFHDVVETWPGPLQVWREEAAPQLESHEFSSTLACGRKKVPCSSAPLPMHFFTLVLNGRPFLEHHIKVFEQLPPPWHWHVIEGVAELNHDTAWSKKLGGQVTAALHRNGLSHDGTTEYLDELARKYPGNVTIYRKPAGAFWDGKLEMVNAPLARIQEPCLLWQIDSDELWTIDQLRAARDLFQAHPEKTAAFYSCHYFVGEKLVITTRNTYGNHADYEWIRTWRFTPGCRWAAHEPPRLCRPAGPGRWVDLAGVNPFRQAETEAAGLTFQHFAYATPEQLQFKETYYGYAGALRQWRQLQNETALPVALKQHFSWVTDGAQVNTAESQGVVPLATREASGAWRFTANPPATPPKRILFVRTDAIGDTVLAASMLPLLRGKYPGAQLAVLCRAHVSELYLACPFVDTVICFDWAKVKSDPAARGQVLREIADFHPDLILNSIYSREALTEVLILAQRAPQVIGLEGDLCNISAQDRAEYNQLYSRLLPSPGDHQPEIQRHRDFLAGLGIASDRLQPQVWTAPEDDALAEAFFKEQQLDSSTTIALFPGAQHDWKIYPRLADALRSLKGYRFLIFGGTEVARAADQLAANLPGPSLNLAGRTTLREMAALFRKCRLYIGADSAGAHIACAVGLPNVVVLGGGHFGRFLPYSPLTSVVCLPLECYGCNWACRFPTVHCVKDLDPAVVAEAVDQTLAGRLDRPRVFVQGHAHWQPGAGAPPWKSAAQFLAATGAEIIPVNCAGAPAVPADSPAPGSALAPTSGRAPESVSGSGPVAAPGPAPAMASARASACAPAAAAAAAPASLERTPLVSVIVSAYAAEAYLQACLEDLEAQTIADQLEILVIDSGSPENERAIVEKFQQRYSNIRYLRTTRETLYAAWNRAIGMARGRYITNANCDDAHRADALELLVASLEAHPEADLAYGDYFTTSVPNDSFARPHILRHVIHPQYHPATVTMYCVTGCHPMWRKTVFDKLGLFDPTFTAPGDYEFLFRFVQAGGRAVHVPQPLSLFFQNPEGLSRKSAAQTANENERILGKYRREMPITSLFKVDPSEASAVARAWVALGNLAMQHEVPWFSNYVQDLPYACFCYEQALQADPRNQAAAKNRLVARLLQERVAGERRVLQHRPADRSEPWRAEIERGLLQLASVDVAPAVEPLEFGAPAATRTVPSGAILPASEENVGLDGARSLVNRSRPGCPVRLAAPFLNRSGQASDALNLALPLAERLDLATVDLSEPYALSFDEHLPAAVRDTLLRSRSRFNFILGGIGISHRSAGELNRVRGVAYHIGRTMFEADRLPLEWVKICNQMDELWVPSRFNVEVFASSGVVRDKLVVIPGAVDAREFDPARHQPLPLPGRAAFNFLAVFDWGARKGWDVLLAAYLREFSAQDDVCLYLRAGLLEKTDATARAGLEQQIRELTRSLQLGDKKLPRFEILSEEIALAEMPGLYRAADCVVSPSRGEAWGRVAHEAMMMARPVIATNWGGHADFLSAETAYPLDYELVSAAHLELKEWAYHGRRWANPSEKHLRELMRHVQRNPGEARAKGVKARAHMEKHFSSDVVADQIVARLALIEEQLTKPSCPPAQSRNVAGVERPGTDPAPRVGHRKSITVALEGSFLDFGSLSHVNRELSRQLSRQSQVSLSCVGKNIVPPALAGDRLLMATGKGLNYPGPKQAHVTIRHAWPPNWDRPASGAWVLIQPWEYGVLPGEWVRRLAEVDEVWAPSEYVRRVYVESGVDPAKVHVVPNGIDPEQFHPQAKPMALATRKKFKFLFVGGTIHRKGPDVLLKAYLERFTAADDVSLVIKDFGGRDAYAGQTCEALIRAAQRQPNAPEILYLDQDLPAEALPGLYTACDCLVHPYRGEGFGLPVLEAMACGLPVILTGGGSTDDFASDEIAYRLPALKKTFGASVSGMKLVREGWLLEPDRAALAERMAWVASHSGEARAKGLAASELVRRDWTWERAARIAAQRAHELVSRRDARPPEAPSRASKPFALPPVAKIGHLGQARESLRQGNLPSAWNAARAALEARPFHPEAFLFLAEIAQAAGDPKRAKSFAQHASRLAPKWKPARQFLKSPPARGASRTELPELAESYPHPRPSVAGPRPSLTVVLITKNEERFLGRCLESVREVAQQIVVVDTGSTDRTRDIAARYGAECHSFEWCDDFSAARNAALERATGDWVLMLDADEELLPGQQEALEKALQDSTALAFRLPMIDLGREEEGVSYVPRLFRNAPGLFYLGRVHEQVFSSVEARRAEWGLENKFCSIRLLHHGYTRELVRSRDKIARNLRLLQKAMEELPGEPNLLMNLGLELVRAGRLDDGLEQYDAAFRALSARPAEEVVPELRETLLTQFCTHLLTAKNYAEVVRVLRSLIARQGGLTATLHWLLGLAFLESRNYVDGAEQMRQCLAKRKNPALSPINKNILKAGPSHCLAVCLAALKQSEAANQAFRAALADDPDARPVQMDYARFLAENGHETEALKWVHQMIVREPSDARLWQFGGRVALSKPEFLEFACDWTGEAVKFFPAHLGIVEQRAEALLLHGRAQAAWPCWRQVSVTASASQRAALLICETVLGQPLSPVPEELAGRVNQEFVGWYRRLLAANASQIVQALNQRTDTLRRVIPAAAAILERALEEARQ